MAWLILQTECGPHVLSDPTLASSLTIGAFTTVEPRHAIQQPMRPARKGTTR